MPRYVCQCGGVIDAVRPPKQCPHCGAAVARVRTRGQLTPIVLVALLFAALVAFVVWLTRLV
jgi:hypothetical protein